MSLTRDEMERMLSSDLGRGYALNKLHNGRRWGYTLTASQRAFLEEVVESKKTKTTIPQHPADVARSAMRRDRGDLTPVELAWLQRLPLDPSQVTFDAAVELASLSASVSHTEAPASARLVDSIWGPVRALHDRRVAEAKLQSTKENQPSMPASAQGVIQDELEETHAGLGSGSLALEAREVLTAWEARRQQDWEDAVHRAEQELAEVAARQTQLAETTREATSA